MGTQGYWLFLFSWRRVRVRGGEELCPDVGRMGHDEDLRRRNTTGNNISGFPAPHPTLCPGSDLISPDQTLSAPRVTRLIRHQTGAGASPLQELTRRQFVARVSDPINPSYPVHTVVNTPRVHTQIDLGLTGDLLSIN